MFFPAICVKAASDSKMCDSRASNHKMRCNGFVLLSGGVAAGRPAIEPDLQCSVTRARSPYAPEVQHLLLKKFGPEIVDCLGVQAAPYLPEQTEEIRSF